MNRHCFIERTAKESQCGLPPELSNITSATVPSSTTCNRTFGFSLSIGTGEMIGGTEATLLISGWSAGMSLACVAAHPVNRTNKNRDQAFHAFPPTSPWRHTMNAERRRGKNSYVPDLISFGL